MEKYAVRLVKRSHTDPFLFEGIVETRETGFKQRFETIDELHAILSALEDGVGYCSVVWVPDRVPGMATASSQKHPAFADNA